MDTGNPCPLIFASSIVRAVACILIETSTLPEPSKLWDYRAWVSPWKPLPRGTGSSHYDPQQSQIAEGLNLLSNTCVLPHFNNFGKGWAKLLSTRLLTVVLIGIDEQTGMIDDAHGGSKVGWRVYGAGSVTLYHNGEPTEYKAGESFKDNFIMDG